MATKEKELRINEAIRVKEVRLLGEDGTQQVLQISQALQRAKDMGLDLIEVAPQAVPPVCKILDFGKYCFDKEKKLKEARKKQKLVKIKEVRMQPLIETHDLQFKTKYVKSFLEEGNKVKVTIRFKGRQLAHTEFGKDVLMKMLELLDGEYAMDRPPMMEGRFMSMILNPKGKK